MLAPDLVLFLGCVIQGETSASEAAGVSKSTSECWIWSCISILIESAAFLI